jgi:NTE family protein
MTSFNEAFRSNQFLAVGVLPIWNIRPSLYLRGEIYGFFPLQSLYDGANGVALKETSWSHVQSLTEVALVYNLPVTNISLYLNRYSYPQNNWNFGVNLGFLIFAKRFIE